MIEIVAEAEVKDLLHETLKDNPNLSSSLKLEADKQGIIDMNNGILIL